MKKHELLEKAMRDYPAGTKCISTHGIEFTSSGTFFIDGTGSVSDKSGRAIHSMRTDEWAEIVKQSILDGKVAIQVNNEREFKLLMEHYESKGWRSQWIDVNKYPYYVDYKDKFDSSFNTEPFTTRGETIIPFSDFAKEANIKLPEHILTSEDGVKLYEGDKLVAVRNSEYGWWLYMKNGVCGFGWKGCGDKIFSTKEAAEAWIKEQNKPVILTTYDGVDVHSGTLVWFVKDNADFSNLTQDIIEYGRVVTGTISLENSTVFSTRSEAVKWVKEKKNKIAEVTEKWTKMFESIKDKVIEAELNGANPKWEYRSEVASRPSFEGNWNEHYPTGSFTVTISV